MVKRQLLIQMFFLLNFVVSGQQKQIKALLYSIDPNCTDTKLDFTGEQLSSFASDQLAGWFVECSRGAASLQIYVHPKAIPMSCRRDVPTCERSQVYDFQYAAIKALKQENIDVDSYSHRVMVMPKNMNCQWLGMANVGWFDANVPYGYAWITGEVWNRTQVYAHEIAHNLGLGHSMEDETCAMGYCCGERCLNAPHSHRMGWLRPVARWTQKTPPNTWKDLYLNASAFDFATLEGLNGTRYYASYRTSNVTRYDSDVDGLYVHVVEANETSTSLLKKIVDPGERIDFDNFAIKNGWARADRMRPTLRVWFCRKNARRDCRFFAH